MPYKDTKKRNEMTNLWKKRNPDKVREYQKKWELNCDKEKLKEYKKKWSEENKDKIKKLQSIYRQENKDKIRESKRKWRENNKDKDNETTRNYLNNRRKVDPLFKLKENIGCLIRISIKNNGYKKTSKTNTILGTDYETFKKHLEGLWEPWMSWDNYGKYKKDTFNYGWDIDHIIPTSSAKTEEEVLKLNHYTNLKPLCSKVNRYIKRDVPDMNVGDIP